MQGIVIRDNEGSFVCRYEAGESSTKQPKFFTLCEMKLETERHTEDEMACVLSSFASLILHSFKVNL